MAGLVYTSQPEKVRGGVSLGQCVSHVILIYLFSLHLGARSPKAITTGDICSPPNQPLANLTLCSF